jgi:hypothetical protein
LAGFLAGLAMISEYTVAPLVVLLGLRVLRGWRLTSASWLCLGAVPPLALLLLYNALCFGSPWSLSSAHEAAPQYAEIAHHGIFGIGPPSPKVMFAFFFDPSRGLVLFSPFWLWAVPGFLAWWRSRKDRADCAFAMAAVALSVVVLSGYAQWGGGFCLGIRYLVPVTFFAALGIPFALKSVLSRWLFAAAVGFSVAQLFVLTPRGRTSRGTSCGPRRTWPADDHRAAPNPGHLLGLPSVWSLVPPALTTAAVLWLVIRTLRGRPPDSWRSRRRRGPCAPIRWLRLSPTAARCASG